MVFAALVAVAVLAALGAAAHEVLHVVERGNAVAMKLYFPDGEVLAYTQYEVFSPADATIPYQKGRTDRGGYLAFVPDVAGGWRVKVVDDTGHGLDTVVDVGARTAASNSSVVSTAAFVLRPLVGLAVIGGVFVLLFALYRRKGIPT